MGERKAMRLGINTLFMVPGDVGGTETYLCETSVAALRDYPKVEFILFTNIENDEHFKKMCSDYTKVSFICLNFKAANRPTRIILEQIKLPLVARRHNLDILWSPGYTAPFFSPCPQVVTVCDLKYKSYPEDMTTVERVTLDTLVRSACYRCYAVLAISEFSRQEIIRHKLASPDKIHTVLLGVEKSFGSIKKDDEIKNILDGVIPLEMPYILCVVHTYPHKKVHLLVEAFSQVKDQIPHNLVIVGRPRRGEDNMKEAVALVKDNSRIIRFTDGVSYTVLQTLFQCADMFILPSAYEGFGLPVVEAMMAGIPVITSREASLSEVGGAYAFYMDKGDSSTSLRSYDSFGKHMVNWARCCQVWAI